MLKGSGGGGGGLVQTPSNSLVNMTHLAGRRGSPDERQHENKCIEKVGAVGGWEAGPGGGGGATNQLMKLSRVSSLQFWFSGRLYLSREDPSSGPQRLTCYLKRRFTSTRSRAMSAISIIGILGKIAPQCPLAVPVDSR